MTNDRAGVEIRGKIENLLQTVDGHLPDFRVDGAGSQVHEGGMQSYRQAGVPQDIGDFYKIIPLKTIEAGVIEADFRVDFLSDHHGQELVP
jgi:hypothetical protein